MQRGYRELTVATLVVGTLLGAIMTASMAYAGLVIGFVVPTSAIAAILGWGVLRGVLRRGSIVENNINQTVASAMVTAAAGIIFTLPALFLMNGVHFSPWAIGIASIAGAFLGNLFIIPLRKQMIDLERLRFPAGIAVAEVLRTPGAGQKKALLLGASTLLALGFGLLEGLHVVPGKVDLGPALGLPAYVPNVWALSLLSVGAGYISGRAGLVVLLGGVLANWVIAPLVVHLGWVVAPAGVAPDAVAKALAGIVHDQMTRPLGIGFLLGGALAGVALALPMMRAAFASLSGQKGGGEELSIRWVYAGLVASFVLLAAAALFENPSLALWRVLVVAVLGALWMWLAGVIVAECAGLTGWSPVSGMALLAVAAALVITGGDVGVAILIGASVSVATAEGSDMMGDLKTGHLVGAHPRRQQIAQLLVSWLGPGIAVLTVYLIWSTVKFGPANPAVPAPQAVTLRAVVLAVQGGNVPLDKYFAGALVGGGLTLGTGGGMGVLVGLSMYLPMFYVLPYGLGCVLQMAAQRFIGKTWSNEIGVPVAAGLLVGDSLAGVVLSSILLAKGMR
jgi:putative OPT family oligopeptide transporter